MTIDKLKSGERFVTVLTGRVGAVKETGINYTVEWDSRTVKDVTGQDVKVNYRPEIISSKTEVEKL